MNQTLNINSEITSGKYKGKTVGDLVTDKKIIFTLIKQGVIFDDEVLSKAGIKKIIRDVKVEQILVDHEKDNKVYQKETTSLSKILKEINTIENVTAENEEAKKQEEEKNNIYENIEE